MRVLVLKGGPDAEREVSIKSGSQVAAALARANAHVNEITIDRLDLADLRALDGDVIFPVLHGPWGEGGPLQELLEQDGRPYVGCQPAAARLAGSLMPGRGASVARLERGRTAAGGVRCAGGAAGRGDGAG